MTALNSSLIDRRVVAKKNITFRKTVCFFGCLAIVCIWVMMFIFIINSRLDFPTVEKVKLAFNNSYVCSCENTNGLITVFNYDGKAALFDKKGKQMLPFEFESVEGISMDSGESFCIQAKIGECYALYNPRCEELLSLKCSAIKKLDENFLEFTKDNRNGVVHYENGVIIPAEYDSVKREVVNGSTLFKIKQNSKFGVADRVGNIIIDLNCLDVKPVTVKETGYLLAKTDKSLLYDNAGNCRGEIIQKYFDTNSYLIKLDNKIGAGNLSKNGTLIPYSYDSAEIASIGANKYLWAKSDSGTDLYNEKGSLTFADVHVLSGCYSGKKEGKYGVFDENGKTLVPYEYDGIKDVLKLDDNSIFIAEKGQKYGCVDETGKELTEFSYDKIEYVDRDRDQIYLAFKSDENKHLASINNGTYGIKCKKLFDYEGQFVILKANGKMYFRTKNETYGYELYNYLGELIISARRLYNSVKFKNIYVSNRFNDYFTAVDEYDNEYRYDVNGSRITSSYYWNNE